MCVNVRILKFVFFFFNDTATTEIYTLSLHDALPIFHVLAFHGGRPGLEHRINQRLRILAKLILGEFNFADRKSTRLNSSHSQISYAVFCLKKKKINITAGIVNAQSQQRTCSLYNTDV